MTTPPHHHDPGMALEPDTMRCPECGEPAQLVAPRDWFLAGFAARPAASHLDGTPLCPVPGPHGSHPAEPIGAPARLTLWQAVRRNALAHPDWTTADHLAWLDGEGHNTETLTADPAKVVGRWVAEHRRTARLPVPPTATETACVYVVAGGDMVSAYDNPDPAWILRMVMEAAGLDTIASTLTPAQWATAQEVLRTEHPNLVITDLSQRAAGETA